MAWCVCGVTQLRGYATRKNAENRAKFLTQRHRVPGGHQARVYPCDECCRWHLVFQPGGPGR